MVAVSVVNEIGSAPYLSWLASAVALSWVKLPLISAWPLVITACEVGAVMT